MWSIKKLYQTNWTFIGGICNSFNIQYWWSTHILSTINTLIIFISLNYIIKVIIFNKSWLVSNLDVKNYFSNSTNQCSNCLGSFTMNCIQNSSMWDVKKVHYQVDLSIHQLFILLFLSILSTWDNVNIEWTIHIIYEKLHVCNC